MSSSLVNGREYTSRLDNKVSTVLTPRDQGGVLPVTKKPQARNIPHRADINRLSVHVDNVAINDQVAALDLHFTVVWAMGGVVLEEIGLQRDIRENQIDSLSSREQWPTNHVLGVQEGVVDSHNDDCLLAQGCTEHEAANAAETNANS